MPTFSPTAEGFRLIFRRPAIPFAEIAWRWSIAAAAWFLSVFFLTEYIDSLSVNKLDRLLLESRQPVLVWRALERIFHGSAFRFTESGLVLVIALIIGWIIVASLGRVATLKSITLELGIPFAPSGFISPLMGLNFLRAAVAFAAMVGVIGAALIASGVWASTNLSGVAAVRLWLLVLISIWFTGRLLNWFLSVAAIFVATDSLRAFPAIVAAVRWCRERLGPILATGSFFGLIHGGAFVAAWTAAFMLFSMAGALGPGPTFFFLFAIIAIYCAIADFLYIGRLTGYLAMIRGEEFAISPPESIWPVNPPTSAVDESELILSDVPVPAT